MFIVMYLLSSLCHLIKDFVEDYLNYTIVMTENVGGYPEKESETVCLCMCARVSVLCVG